MTDARPILIRLLSTAGKGNEVWANFEFVNIDENDRDLLAFAIKADKPGRKDRFRVDHDNHPRTIATRKQR